MSTFAHSMLARLFRIYRHAINVNTESRPVLQAELFIEAALGAALSTGTVWEHIANRLRLDAPRTAPKVTSQDMVDKGRTDLTLNWPERHELVLELKVGAPPTEQQVRDYLESGKDVLVVAKTRPTYVIEPVGGHRYHGSMTWRDLRELDWPDAPLLWRQLHHLIDEMGIAMKGINLSNLIGMQSSWGVWEVIEQGANVAANEVCNAFNTPESLWLTRGRRKAITYQYHALFARWFWADPWRANIQLSGLCGLFMGRPNVPTLVTGTPDLVLLLRVNPASALGKTIAQDQVLRECIDIWKVMMGDGIVREAPLPDSDWEFLRVRSTSLRLVQVEDAEMELTAWMKARAKELVDTGVVRRLTELYAAAQTGEQVPESPDAGPGSDSTEDEA